MTGGPAAAHGAVGSNAHSATTPNAQSAVGPNAHSAVASNAHGATTPNTHGVPAPNTHGVTAPSTHGVPAPNTVAPLASGHAHRDDLDGLRGVAIALVVAFHVWMGRVSGGVDIFLVLSGFFFTGMLLRRSDTGGPLIGWTLRRTGRRLLPALTLVLGAAAVATVALRPYTQWDYISGQLLASGLYLQNWYLAAAEMDYAAPDPSISPLQHLWSMAVQGQFYLLILVIAAAWARLRTRLPRARGVLLLVLVGLGAVSFRYASIGAAQHQAWTYYDTGARLWELLAGAALAVVAHRVEIPALLRGFAAALGLAMVLSCGVLFDGAAEFPGPAAVFPVAAAVLLIVSGLGLSARARPWANRVLASRVCTELGAIAYPLYLWHWPVLIFYLAETGRARAGFADGLVVIVVSLALATATTRLLENPLRRRDATGAPVWVRRGLGVAVAALGVTVLFAGSAWQLRAVADPPRPAPPLEINRYPGASVLTDKLEVPPEPLRPAVSQGFADAPPPTLDGCITPDREVRSCVYGEAGATRTIAVVGGSHSEQWIPALEILGRANSFRIVTYLKESCPLTLSDQPSYSETPFPECREWSLEVLDRLAAERPDWVFTISTRFRPYSDGDEVPPEFLDVWTALDDRGLAVLALRDTPRLRRDGIFYSAVDCLATRGTTIHSCGIDRPVALDPVDPATAPAAAYPNIFPIDLSDAVCRPDRCQVAEGNVLIYRDEHHLTASYIRTLAPELGRQLGAITRWW
ncbi:acyltransferase [Nocardia sp. 2]|uniref:Acyltransferase n=1 Tax=Nocardia acididurans TaxID=2802282 RepID=A0ABS1MGC9_9NOCA|nr:acyltransferase family protein [Nocardia acididurans]MBL1079634.1 acyltransferase [Nocardia acididurans]